LEFSATSPLASCQWGFLLFPEKEAKKRNSASQKTSSSPRLGEADPGGLGACPQENIQDSARLELADCFLLFPEKEAKSVVLLRRRRLLAQNSAKATLGVWGRASRKHPRLRKTGISRLFSFSRKRSKKRSFASQKASSNPTLRVLGRGVAPRKRPLFNEAARERLKLAACFLLCP
jgi:hypothetical protein